MCQAAAHSSADHRSEEVNQDISTANSGRAMMTMKQREKVNLVADFFDSFSSNDESEEDNLASSIGRQIDEFRNVKGILLITEDGSYNCPLMWWKENASKYPYIWSVAQQILHILVTSAPSE